MRVGFIGAGQIAGLHARGYAKSDLGRIFAVCDTDETIARARAAEWGADRVYTDYHELLADPAVDAVEVLSPHHLHCEMTVAALEAGKHTSVQKPMANTMAEADAMVAAGRRSGNLLRVLENFRYYPAYTLAKRLIDEGAIGEPQSIRVTVVDGNHPDAWPSLDRARRWRYDRRLNAGGPVVFDHGFHVFSIVMFLMGPVDEVMAWIGESQGSFGVIDRPAMIAWKHTAPQRFGSWDSAGSGELLVRSKYYADDELCQVVGSKGILWVNRCSGELLQAPPVVLYRDGEPREFHDLETDWGHSFELGTRDFLEAIRDGRPSEMTGEEGREVLRFTLAAHLSARLGRNVTLREAV
jgi:predicted dehydrogenase